MNVKTVKVFLIFVLLVASIIPMIQAPSDTASPDQSNDDAMRTGIGSYFGDTAFLTLQDEVVDIVVGVRFRGVDVPQGAKINNATLYVRSVYAYPIGEAYVTLTGDDADNSRAFNDSSSFNRIYTNAFKVWNVSDVVGTVLGNVSITEIVQEIVDRPGWSSGNDLSLIMFSDSGTPRREFVSWDGSWEDPWIVVWFDEELTEEEIIDDIQSQVNETDPGSDPEDWDWEKNETYRGYDSYLATESGHYLNFSTFELIGTESAKITGLNDTYFLATNLYTHTDAYLRRNYTDYRNNASSSVSVKFGIRVLALPWSGPGTYQWYGLWGVSDVHGRIEEDWNDGYIYAGRTWADSAMGTAWAYDDPLGDSVAWSPRLYSAGGGLPWTLWYHIRLQMQGMISNVTVWNDPEMTSLNNTFDDVFAPGPGNMNDTLVYEYMIARWTSDPSATGITAEFLSFDEDLDTLIFIVYPNGTLVSPDPLPDGVDPEDFIDDLLGGAQPEDPQDDEYTVIGKFTWKLLVLAVGMIMLLGTPVAGVYYGGDTATWIKILFIMFFGIGILWQIKSM